MARGLLAGVVFVLCSIPGLCVGAELAIAMSGECPGADRLMEGARNETVRVWASAGLQVRWMMTSELPYRSPSADWLVVQCVPGRSAALPAPGARGLPIAAIRFVASKPTHAIVLSLANAQTLLDRDAIESRILGERFKALKELRLSRMLGRAIAHEIGHFLSASGAHAPSGLMRAVHSVGDLIGESLYPFRVDPSVFPRQLARINPAIDQASARSDATGSSLAALRAGTYAAIDATRTTASALPPTAIGSVVETPTSSDASTREETSVAAIPAIAPVTAGARPWGTTRRITSARVAPSATLTPISPVRCATRHETTP